MIWAQPTAAPVVVSPAVVPSLLRGRGATDGVRAGEGAVVVVALRTVDFQMSYICCYLRVFHLLQVAQLSHRMGGYKVRLPTGPASAPIAPQRALEVGTRTPATRQAA